MIHTKPVYTKGDNLKIIEYFKHVFANERLYFSSFWKGWKKATLYWGVPILTLCCMTAAFVLYKNLSVYGQIDWWLIRLFFFGLLVVSFSIVWIMVTIEYMLVRRTGKKMKRFVSVCIPDAEMVLHGAPSRCLVLRQDFGFEVVYSVDAGGFYKGRFYRRRGYFFIAAYYDVKEQPVGTGEHLSAMALIEDDWLAYCNGKESCVHLRLGNHIMYAVYEDKEHFSSNEVMKAMDQLQYLFSRLKLIHLPVNLGLEDIPVCPEE